MNLKKLQVNNNMKILVLGAGGMIGSAMFRVLGSYNEYSVWGSIRNKKCIKMFSNREQKNIVLAEDLLRAYNINKILSELKPQIVINCVGLTKHQPGSNNPQISLPINALFPHELADLCSLIGARVIHISTDCVFSGMDGPYTEEAQLDAMDMYGKSKYLGELNRKNTITLRTSTVGHEYLTEHGLLEWFLAQMKNCKGYANAVFSGLTNIEFAKVVAEYVIHEEDMTGIYHVGGEAINKFELLKLFASVYEKNIDITRDETFVINRSLISDKFNDLTGYKVSKWEDMVKAMRNHKTLNQY
jgi:dTDP-4-dehydrorhamnose reductase